MGMGPLGSCFSPVSPHKPLGMKGVLDGGYGDPGIVTLSCALLVYQSLPGEMPSRLPIKVGYDVCDFRDHLSGDTSDQSM